MRRETYGKRSTGSGRVVAALGVGSMRDHLLHTGAAKVVRVSRPTLSGRGSSSNVVSDCLSGRCEKTGGSYCVLVSLC